MGAGVCKYDSCMVSDILWFARDPTRFRIEGNKSLLITFIHPS